MSITEDLQGYIESKYLPSDVSLKEPRGTHLDLSNSQATESMKRSRALDVLSVVLCMHSMREPNASGEGDAASCGDAVTVHM